MNLLQVQTLLQTTTYIENKYMAGFIDFFVKKREGCATMLCSECNHCLDWAKKAVVFEVLMSLASHDNSWQPTPEWNSTTLINIFDNETSWHEATGKTQW